MPHGRSVLVNSILFFSSVCCARRRFVRVHRTDYCPRALRRGDRIVAERLQASATGDAGHRQCMDARVNVEYDVTPDWATDRSERWDCSGRHASAASRGDEARAWRPLRALGAGLAGDVAASSTGPDPNDQRPVAVKRYRIDAPSTASPTPESRRGPSTTRSFVRELVIRDLDHPQCRQDLRGGDGRPRRIHRDQHRGRRSVALTS
jgi:hypothetical protein